MKITANYLLPVVAALLIGNTAIAQGSSGGYVEKKGVSDPAEILRNEYTLPSGAIAIADITWKKRVWCDYDMREVQLGKKKHPQYPSGGELARLLIDGAMKGDLVAYSTADDRFTTELTKDEVTALATNANGVFDAGNINKFRVKGDWLYLGADNLMVFRIVGIAPLKEVKAADGTVSEEPAFWIYYPQSRKYLSQYKVPNTKDDTSWDHLLISIQHKEG